MRLFARVPFVLLRRLSSHLAALVRLLLLFFCHFVVLFGSQSSSPRSLVLLFSGFGLLACRLLCRPASAKRTPVRFFQSVCLYFLSGHGSVSSFRFIMFFFISIGTLDFFSLPGQHTGSALLPSRAGSLSFIHSLPRCGETQREIRPEAHVPRNFFFRAIRKMRGGPEDEWEDPKCRNENVQ